jgi:hypothetical protein
MISKLQAPFSAEQVERLNAFQKDTRFHPFTCGNDRSDAAHVKSASERNEYDTGILVATKEGWICPACGYRQYWAHGYMADPLPLDDGKTGFE